MTSDVEKLAKMEQMNWKPAVIYWKAQADRIKQQYDELVRKNAHQKDAEGKTPKLVKNV
jgi:hypothetical protein